MKPLSIALILLLASSGCGYRTDMNAGAEHAASGNWQVALADYQSALERRPRSEEAQEQLDYVTPYAIEVAMFTGEDALTAGEYVNVLSQVAYVAKLDPDHPQLAVLTQRTSDAMAAALQQLIDDQKWFKAWDLLLVNAELFPNAPHIDGSIEAIQDHYLGLSEELLLAGRYQQSLDALGVILTQQPAVADWLAPKQRRVRDAWADNVLLGVGAFRSDKHVGAEAVLYARAYEIAARPRDLAQLKRLKFTLRSHGMLHVSLESLPAGARSDALISTLGQSAESIVGVSLVNKTNDTLRLRLNPPLTTCKQTSDVTQQAQNYVAGTRQYDNPVYAEQSVQLDAVLRDAPALHDAARSAKGDLDLHQAQASACDASMQPWRQQANNAQFQINSANAQIQGRQELLSDLERTLHYATSAGDRGAMADAQHNLDHQRPHLTHAIANYTTQRNQAQFLLQEANGYLQQIQYECRDVGASLSDAQHRYKSAAQRSAANQQSIDRLRSDLAGISPTVQEDIVDTFWFDVHAWKRECSSAIVADFRPDWEPGLTSTAYSANRSTTDSSNAAFPRYGVVADPLTYSISDVDLVADTDKEMGGQIRADLTARVDKYYAGRSESALSLTVSKPDKATTEILALHLAVPSRLSANTKRDFADFLRFQYALQDANLVLVQ